MKQGQARPQWRQIWTLSGLLIIALLVASCAPLDPSMQVSAQTQATDEDMETVVSDIWREYEASIEAGDAARWGELWVEEGVKFPPDGPMLEGKAAIVDNMVAWMEMATAQDVAITNQSIETAGDFAFLRGLFTVDATLNANGAPVMMDGKYMSIIQRQPDGSWKLYRDIFNSNAPPAGPADDLEAVTAAVEANWAEYSAALNSDDIDRWAALWLDDGVQMPPGTALREGKATIAEAVGASMEAFAYDMEITNLEVLLSGDMAVARGLYTAELTPKAGGDNVYVDGKYMSVLMRQPDGSWKIYRDIFNSNVP